MKLAGCGIGLGLGLGLVLTGAAAPVAAQAREAYSAALSSRLTLRASAPAERSVSLRGVAWLAELRLGPALAGTDLRSPAAGFRASSGWLWAPGTAAASLSSLRLPALAAVQPGLLRMPAAALALMDEDAGAQRPAAYVGLGYTSYATGEHWGFSADMGWAAAPADSRGTDTARDLSLGSHAADRALRQLRWQPVLQVGMRLQF